VSQSPTKPEASPEVPPTASVQDGQVEEPLVKESPAHQKKRRRRSSGLTDPMLDSSQDDVFSSSPSGDITTNSSPIRVEEGIESSDESDTDGDTAMSMDEATAHTVTSQESGSSTHSSLEERLRQAASQAGTRGIDYDENGEELSMELVTGTVTHAFQPWARNHEDAFENNAMYDQENVDPFSSSRKAPPLQPAEDDGVEEEEGAAQTEEMTMEVTRAVGGIVSKQSPQDKSRKSPVSRRRSSIRRRRSSGAESSLDETMEFTVMQGGIIDDEAEEITGNMTRPRAGDDGLTMEFTSAVGAILGSSNRRISTASDQTGENDSMDMTAAVGGILQTIEEHTEPQTDIDDDQTSAMEMTRPVTSIIQQAPGRQHTSRRSSSVRPAIAKDVLSPSHAQPVAALSTTPKSTPKSLQVASVASETGSPSLALKPRLSGRSQRKSTSVISTTPPSKAKNLSPLKPLSGTPSGTPSKQMTPVPHRAETPNKTPLSANMIAKSASPKKLFRAELQARASPRSTKRESAVKTTSLFSRDAETGQQTPSVILRATRQSLARRKSSGIGIDKEGVGSPRISELLDRRSSIGDAVPQFKLGAVDASGSRLEDPQQLAQEVEAERVEEHRRESGRFIMEQEADERVGDNNTLQLKDMIQAMSPKKPKASKLRGRKSLAIGGAKGLLGKRPAELDLEEEDDEAERTPKRLKAVSRDSSPVKQIHLPKPPSKDETTGRLGAKLQNSLQGLVSNSNSTPKIGPLSPVETTTPGSPSTTGRYRDIHMDADGRPTSFEDKLDNVIGAIDMSTAQMLEQTNAPDEPKVSLQEFLNMTNIHFIELSTTKRRHTLAQGLPNRESQEGVHHNTLEQTFVAAATTLPLLELYQHSTRELKSYISTGRKIVRSIEAETLAEQPPLFREYIEARPDVKLVMDNQFRNGKANARLQSKEGWYQWRTQLVDGLKSGLQTINSNLSLDLKTLDHQLDMLDSILPGLLQQQSALRKQKPSLQQSVEELDSIDHEILKSARRELHAADEYNLQRTALLSSLQEQMAEKEETLAAAAELQAEIRDQIEEADRVREEHKGWSAADVLVLKRKVEQIENQSGWRLISAEEEVDEPNEFGTALTMMYKNELRLFMYPQVYQATPPAARRRSGRRSASTSGPSAPISLTFAPATEDEAELPVPELSTEKRFFLQLIRSQLHAFSMMPKGSISAKSLLSTVSQGWDLGTRISQELRLLNMVGITTASILGDEKLGVKVMLILPKRGRVDIEFAVSVTILTDGNIVAATSVTATAMYGDATNSLTSSKTRKVQQALSKEIESRHLGDGAWVNAVHGFEAWMAAQHRPKEELKQQEQVAPTPAAQPPTAAPAPAATIPVPNPKRSPLASKRANMVQKKGLPVPKQRFEKNNFNLSTSSLPGYSMHEKENFNPILSMNKAVIDNSYTSSHLEFQDQVAKPAMPPEMQESMMHTPIKRVGALRRSPI